jgi:hypothetical protein
MLRTAVTELRQALGAGKAAVRLALPGTAGAERPATPAAGGPAPASLNGGTGELRTNGGHGDVNASGGNGKSAGANGARKNGPSEGSV